MTKANLIQEVADPNQKRNDLSVRMLPSTTHL